MLRLRQIALVARDLDAVTEGLTAVFGLAICHRDPAVAEFGLHNALMPIGAQFLEVVAPIRDHTAAGRYLERRRGDGGYMVILQCNDHRVRKAHIAQMRIRKVADSDHAEYHLMQLHPQDTGGSFLEIDEQVGGEDLNGPWMPAGKNWHPAVRLGVVNAIEAAEIQSAKPREVAERWSEILNLPLDHDLAGNCSLRLDNASLRFVTDHDGRGEGLGGLDLAASDSKRAFDEAKRRGYLHNEEIVVAGMRFRLRDARPS